MGLTLAQRPRLIEPGLPRLEPGTERYRIGGGGAVVLALSTGDRLEIIDVEGRQRGELAVFAPEGREDTAALGLRASGPATGINSLLSGSDEASRTASALLGARGLPHKIDNAVDLFQHESRAGEIIRFQASRSCIVVVHSLDPGMGIDEGLPATDLIAMVYRSNPTVQEAPPLPDPLAEPAFELHVERGTAQAYEVRAGQCIQIIDVAGRQCSDFLAFDARQLQRGRERSFDMTATRSLTGHVYPGPGLFSKFFDQDLQPLLELVRDTVGRHDAFGLACTAKFYEDQGYPGHANCSDNFSAALKPFGIEPRRGWPCLNLFYNTGIGAQNAIFLDDPWSRPGDYVLFRAVTDIVCASTACPDDIDATNAWNPTDIHVRIYPASHEFSRAIAYRMSPDSEAKLTRETPFHPRSSALTRNFTEYRGYWLATKFNNHGANDEYYACREAAIVTDLSPLRKFEVLGPDAETLMQICCTRNMRRLAEGQAVYTALCYESGGMLDDAVAFRMGADRYRLVAGEEYTGKWLRDQASARGLKAWVKSATDQLCNIAVQGPRSRDVLKGVVWTPPSRPALDEIQWFHFTIGRVGDHNGVPIVVSRTGYTGELGYEVFCHPKHALSVWDAIWEAGRPHGLTPLGLEALDMLRIEAGLIFAGSEFSDQTDPFEAGIGFTVSLKSNEEFIGREAVLRRRQNPRFQLVGLELNGNEVAGKGDCVLMGRAQVGTITSGTRSPILRKNIALCRMDAAYAALGTEVEVGKLDGHQKRIPASVVRFPFYDPEKLRPRS
jgi:glycine cleavage system T protein (aminomethyltransferase)